MCGFAFSIGDQPLNQKTIKELIKSLHHRGPDNYGVINLQSENRYCTLVHTRLAIIDTDCPLAKQPLESRKYWIIFNGEIYNYKELRNEFVQKHYDFHTQCDTEVLGALLDTYGEDGIKELEGMWSFVAVKKDLSCWIASRDFFGEKPLFASETTTNDFLGSTPRQIEIMMNDREALRHNEEYLIRYLLHGHRGSLTNKDATVFKEVKRVKPNTTLVRTGLSPIKEIQTVNPLSGLTGDKEINCDRAIYTELSGYIHKSFLADPSIKISCLLSGGLDSSLIASLWGDRKEPAPLIALTLKGKDRRYDESEIVKQTLLGTDYIKHEFVEINPDYSLKWISSIIGSNKDLLLNPNALTGAHVFNAASSLDSKVALTGTGGDELFAGYLVHHLYYLCHLKATDPNRYKYEIEYWNKEQKPYIRNEELLMEPEEFIRKYPNGYWPDNQQESLFIKDGEAKKAQFWPDFTELKDDPFRRSLFIDLFQGSNPASLVNTDYSAMQFGIENRAPLLSSKTLLLLNELNSREFIKNGQTKSIMRNLFESQLPNHVLTNKEKKGFNAGMQDLFNLDEVWDILDYSRGLNIISDSIDIDQLIEGGVNQEKKTIKNGVAKLAFRVMNLAILLN